VSAPTTLVDVQGALTPLACEVLHGVSGVPLPVLRSARIRRSQQNWVRAPWYRYHRGGAITVGHTIWFTRKWFASDGHGDGSAESTWRWLQHLAHEVGHLAQAERYGLGLLGKMRYVAHFAVQYGWRAITFRRAVHDGAALEIEADLGRWVLTEMVGQAGAEHPLVRAVHEGRMSEVLTWCRQQRERLDTLAAHYRHEAGPGTFA
jgi:hypothetical protein